MIKIEVTGNSIGEVADKLLSIGASLLGSGTPSEPIKVDPVMPEVAEMAAAPEPANEATEAPSAPDTSPESGTLTSGTGPTAETASPTELNFETDVAPYVLRVVKEKGKPAAQEILSQFGVEKASNLDPALWPELVEALKGAL